MPTVFQGTAAKLGIGDSIPTTTRLDFLSETLSANEQMRNLGGLRGTRGHALKRNRLVGRDPGGDLILEPNAVEFAAILKYALGGTPSGTSYPLAETLPNCSVQLTNGTRMMNYTNGKCTQLGIAARGKGANLQTTLSFLFTDEAMAAASAFPAISLDETTIPFIFEDLVFTAGGTSYDCFDFAMTLDNAVRTRQVNSLSPTAVYSTDRNVIWEATLPWGDAEALYDAGMATAGVALVATFSVFNTSLTLSSPTVKFPRARRPVTREETMVTIRGQALYNAAAGDELAVTLDSTP